MTLSFAKCAADGALIDRPGGGPFRRDVCGVRVCTPNSVVSCTLALPSASSCELPGLVPFCRASMIIRCWSRTFRLRCSCSRNAGSCVWKPGDKHARPTSWIARPAESRAVSGADGRAVCGPRAPGVLDDRSSRFGLGRAVDILGDPGSFLTLIMGGGPLRSLASRQLISYCIAHILIDSTHELGDIFVGTVERSSERRWSFDDDEPLLLARDRWAGSGALVGGAETVDGRRAAKCRGEMCRSRPAVLAGGAATAVDMAKKASWVEFVASLKRCSVCCTTARADRCRGAWELSALARETLISDRPAFRCS